MTKQSNTPNTALTRVETKQALSLFGSEDTKTHDIVKSSDIVNKALLDILNDTTIPATEKVNQIQLMRTNLSHELIGLNIEEGIKRVVEYLTNLDNTKSGTDLTKKLENSDFLDYTNPSVFIGSLMYESNSNLKRAEQNLGRSLTPEEVEEINQESLDKFFGAIFGHENHTIKAEVLNVHDLTKLFTNLNNADTGSQDLDLLIKLASNMTEYTIYQSGAASNIEIKATIKDSEDTDARELIGLDTSLETQEVFENLPEDTVTILEALRNSSEELYQEIVHRLIEAINQIAPNSKNNLDNILNNLGNIDIDFEKLSSELLSSSKENINADSIFSAKLTGYSDKGLTTTLEDWLQINTSNVEKAAEDTILNDQIAIQDTGRLLTTDQKESEFNYDFDEKDTTFDDL